MLVLGSVFAGRITGVHSHAIESYAPDDYRLDVGAEELKLCKCCSYETRCTL